MAKHIPSGKTYSGRYKPENPDKYVGDPTDIIYRSRPELVLMSRFDRDPNVLKWGSEENTIMYRCKLDGRLHRYIPDFVVLYRRKDGSTIKLLIEYKPKEQTLPPKRRPKQSDKSYLFEAARYTRNVSKWEAARRLAKQRGWLFQIYTEEHIGLDTKPPKKIKR